jgi:hypothetical protein
MSTKTNLSLDTAIFAGFLAVTNPHLTGNTIHEWLSLSFAGAIIVHLLLHWDWLIKVGGGFFRKLFHQSRLNLVVDVLFFTAMTGAMFSGLMISKSILSTLGIQLDVSRSWKSIHSLTSEASIILLGIHFALHWKWVLTNIDRYVLNPIRGLFQGRASSPLLTAQPVRVEKSK